MESQHLLDTKSTALLVIDIQIDGCSPEGRSTKILGKGIHHITTMLPKLKEFISYLKEKGVLIIYSKHIENRELVEENTQYLFDKKNFDFNSYQKNEKGSEIYYLRPMESDIVLEKTTWDIFSNPELEKVLKSKGIKNIIVTGVNTECCVFSTISSAYMKGYNVFVPEELVSTKDNKIETFHTMVLSLIDNYYGFVLKIEKLKDMLT